MTAKQASPMKHGGQAEPAAATGQPSRRRYLRHALLALLILSSAGAGWLYLHYRQDLRAAQERVASGSRLTQTPCGVIEYGEQGVGKPVLSIHGAGGGYD